MPEQRENSVLFSLKELRRIEDDRIRQEETEAQARVEAERRSREDAERRAREEVERRRRDEEDRVRRIEEEKQGHEREGNMRLQEAERRARVEAETRLQEERMRLEIQHRKGKSPMPIVLAVAGVMVVIGGIVLYKVNAKAEADRIASEQKAQQALEERTKIQHEAEERLRHLEQVVAQKEKELATAKTEEERSRIRSEIAQEKKRATTTPSRREKQPNADVAPPPPRPGIRPKKTISDDPLEGLKL
jgi:hypothetical protein